MNTSSCAPYHAMEVLEALKMMHPNKAPGPDGLNALFFPVILGCFQSGFGHFEWKAGPSCPTLNHTNVVLITKIPNATKLVNFHPVSLCNVIYKLVIKVITNRLKNLLPKVISVTQSAFTPGRFH